MGDFFHIALPKGLQSVVHLVVNCNLSLHPVYIPVLSHHVKYIGLIRIRAYKDCNKM